MSPRPPSADHTQSPEQWSGLLLSEGSNGRLYKFRSFLRPQGQPAGPYRSPGAGPQASMSPGRNSAGRASHEALARPAMELTRSISTQRLDRARGLVVLSATELHTQSKACCGSSAPSQRQHRPDSPPYPARRLSGQLTTEGRLLTLGGSSRSDCSGCGCGRPGAQRSRSPSPRGNACGSRRSS